MQQKKKNEKCKRNNVSTSTMQRYVNTIFQQNSNSIETVKEPTPAKDPNTTSHTQIKTSSKMTEK